MSDFLSDFWSIYVAVITVVSIVACLVLMLSYASKRIPKAAADDSTGHVWDENLREWNNPLPRWWMWMFVITLLFSLVYLAFYPGLGSHAGAWNWSSKGQYEDEQARAARVYGPIFDKFLKQDIKAVAVDPEARAIGERLFLNYCAQCHGSDAGGSIGFPNLRDNDWLYGGEPEAIKTSIVDGRNGVMPPFGGAVGGDEGVKDVAHYVLSLSGRTHDEFRAGRGKSKYATICAACHGADGKGNVALGAPNLTDGIWLHGGSLAAISTTITNGRGTAPAEGGAGAMPAHKNLLDAGKIHLLAAYVYGLSAPRQK